MKQPKPLMRRRRLTLSRYVLARNGVALGAKGFITRSLIVLLCVFAGPGSLAAQSLYGRVLDAENGSAVPRALVRLVDRGEKDRSVVVADSLGRYRLPVPEAGEYRIVATSLGYQWFTSPLLGIDGARPYAVDIELDRAPVPIPGLVVTAERFAEMERGVHLIIGVNPKSLRNDIIFRPEIESHLAKAHNLPDLVRWSNLPSIYAKETTDGPCFQWRNRHCLPVFLNGANVTPGFVPQLPLEMMEAVVVLGPGESLAYPSGAVLLYTNGWIP